MTTTTQIPATSKPAPGAMGRIRNVVRLHFANPSTTILIPWTILAAIFLINLAIWWIIVTAGGPEVREGLSEGSQWSGALLWIFVYMMVVAIQAMNLTFPFALGYSVTRRDFYLGSSVVFVLLSAMFSLGLTVLAVIEDATEGWGLGGRMFTPAYFGNGDWWQSFYLFFLTFLFFFFLGAATAAVYVRWRSNGMLVFFGALVVLGVVVIGAVTLGEAWPSVWAWFAAVGLVGAFTWSLVLTAASGVCGYLVMRRATPTN